VRISSVKILLSKDFRRILFHSCNLRHTLSCHSTLAFFTSMREFTQAAERRSFRCSARFRRANSFRCKSKPMRCTFVATTDNATCRSNPSRPYDKQRSNPRTSRLLMHASTPECCRLASPNNSLSCQAFSFLLQRPFFGKMTLSSCLFYSMTFVFE